MIKSRLYIKKTDIKRKSNPSVRLLIMVSMCPSVSRRSTVLLGLVACFYSSHAFAPHLAHSPRIIASNIKPLQPFCPISSGLLIHESSLIQRRGTTEQKQSLNNNNNNNEGVPSSPLDRPVLSAIDAASLFVFAGVGKASHSANGSLDVFAVLVTAFPFLVSWFLVAPLVGSYTPEATKDIKSAAVQTAKGWALAVPLGCVFRGVIKGYVPPTSFVVVTLIATLVILSMGRVGYTFLSELYVEMF
mmetsp:Transcript_16825/g.34685  ORF Transcript_16825/g.34685 Transcript_16825/m.34685 type:complete len:245 (+) Transcript_16825:2-736(+)